MAIAIAQPGGKDIFSTFRYRRSVRAGRNHPSGQAGTRNGSPEQRAWKFLILAEIRNFATLRRQFAPARINRLSADLAARLAATAPDLSCLVVSRTMVEIAFEADRPSALNETLAALRAVAEQAFEIDKECLHIDAIFGVAAVPAQHDDDVALAEEAEIALAEARALDGVATRNVTPHNAEDGQRLAIELDRAIDEGDLVLQYQPKVHVRRQHIGSAEALVRWRHAERGMIPPNDFIPMAERSRLIAKLTLWTLRQAITDQHRLAEAGHDLRLFINVSAQVLGDMRFVEQVRQIVGAVDVKLGFEVTETAVIRDPQVAIRNLQAFADLGIVVAIDDYGAGLSSLAYLKQLPARELKIDKLFVTQLTSSNRDPLIVRSTIDLAHALEMEVVAEGVETHAALALLTVMGCDMVQGYLISRPIGIDALVTFLAEDRHRATPQETRASFTRLATVWKHA